MADFKFLLMIAIILYLIFGIASFILNLIDYKILHASWSKTPWKELAPCQLSCNIFILFSGFIGIILFFNNKKEAEQMFVIIFTVMISLSSLFTWAIGIFSCIGGTIYHKENHQLGCKSKLTGVLEMYNNIDSYFLYADSLLCSNQCQCIFKENVKNEYLNNIYSPGAYSTLQSWIYTSKKFNDEETFNFWDNCSFEVKEEARNRYLETQTSLNHRINYNNFAKYWKKIEEKFKCTGWCQTNYIDPYTLQEKQMLKYIFSDINNGLPEYPGCINRLTNWLPSMVGATGACLIVCAFIQSISIIFLIKIYLNNSNNDEDP